MYLCDKCIVKLIRVKRMQPLSDIYGPNGWAFKNDSKCDGCGEKDSISQCPFFSEEDFTCAGIREAKE